MSSDDQFELTQHLVSLAPLLKKLALTVTSADGPVLRDDIFVGDLSLHELRSDEVITNLVWENMSNLRTFALSHVPGDTGVVGLSNLKYLTIVARPVHTILTNHLFIPTGALINQVFDSSDIKFSIPSFFPQGFANFATLLQSTSASIQGHIYGFMDQVEGSTCTEIGPARAKSR